VLGCARALHPLGGRETALALVSGVLRQHARHPGALRLYASLSLAAGDVQDATKACLMLLTAEDKVGPALLPLWVLGAGGSMGRREGCRAACSPAGSIEPLGASLDGSMNRCCPSCGRLPAGARTHNPLVSRPRNLAEQGDAGRAGSLPGAARGHGAARAAGRWPPAASGAGLHGQQRAGPRGCGARRAAAEARFGGVPGPPRRSAAAGAHQRPAAPCPSEPRCAQTLPAARCCTRAAPAPHNVLIGR
jgi:hypothetical protein